jgi:hypothetical protein
MGHVNTMYELKTEFLSGKASNQCALNGWNNKLLLKEQRSGIRGRPIDNVNRTLEPNFLPVLST